MQPSSFQSPELFDPSAFFPGVEFGAGVQLIGARNMAIASGSVVADNCWLNVCIRDELVRMKIGSRVLLGRQSVISTAGTMEIGDFVLCAPRVYIADSDHCFADIARPVIEQGVTTGRRIVIEENCWIGINAVVSGSLTVGRGSVVAANSVVLGDVPPFCVVAGSPARVVKMYDSQTATWQRVETAADIQSIERARERAPLPTREEYTQILSKNSRISLIDPIVAGRGEHLV